MLSVSVCNSCTWLYENCAHDLPGVSHGTFHNMHCHLCIDFCDSLVPSLHSQLFSHVVKKAEKKLEVETGNEAILWVMRQYIMCKTFTKPCATIVYTEGIECTHTYKNRCRDGKWLKRSIKSAMRYSW